jgi:glycogen operon protein
VPPDSGDPYPYRAQIATDDFDWGMDHPLQTPIEDIVIYEMHVRGFTQHASSGVNNPGTYTAIREKIPYLKELGVNCIELMPIFEFDEFENWRINPETGETLLNYWGYSPAAFFAPKTGYAASGSQGGAINELKALIKELHANGIEIILDVVFNHTAEGNEKGPTISFKGIDSRTYYILTPDGYFHNFSGTGNTFSCNHPGTLSMLIDCLRYWVTAYHVDGFRFDLASIMTRGVDGAPLADPPALRLMAFDPILAGTKLIAEPWDAQGLYHLGSFSAHSRWAEWNGRYRDNVRKFLKGDPGMTRAIASALLGSPDLYRERGPIATINFITAHDGFTLLDLVSYNDKHNDGNCEPGDNGTNDNNSWNSGVEGPSDEPAINELRRRRIKNAIALLIVSQGVPMILMGDEMGRTQGGNNNAYCQDSELNWLNWNLLGSNPDLFHFFKACITFRRAHPVLRNGYFLRGEDYLKKGYSDFTWHGVRIGKPDWSETSRTLAFMLKGEYAKGGLYTDEDIYVALNMHWRSRFFALPPAPHGKAWHLFANTGDHAVHWPGWEARLENQRILSLRSYSIAILVGK